MLGARSSDQQLGHQYHPSGLTAHAIDEIWGPSKASGRGLLGLTARLSERRCHGRVELSRPACKSTHALSFLARGFTQSELQLGGRFRFSQLRNQGTFQLARAGESVQAVLTNPNCTCLDLYLPDSVLQGCLEQDFDNGGSSFALRELHVERDAEITRLARTILQEIEAPSVASNIAIDSATLGLCVVLIRKFSNFTPTAAVPKHSLAAWKVRRVSDRLRQSLAENLTLAELAASVELSPYHFLRAFSRTVTRCCSGCIARASFWKPPRCRSLKLPFRSATTTLAISRACSASNLA